MATPDQHGAALTAQTDTYETWEGPADQLIAAGLITADMLPGAPGRNKTMVTINGGRGRRIAGPDYLQIRKGPGGRYIVTKGRHPSEAQRVREQAHAKERAAARAACVATLKERDADHPATAGAHKITAINTVEKVEAALWDCFAGRPRALFSYDQATINRISALTEELRELAVNAHVVADAERKERETREAIDNWMAEHGFAVTPRLALVH